MFLIEVSIDFNRLINVSSTILSSIFNKTPPIIVLSTLFLIRIFLPNLSSNIAANLFTELLYRVFGAISFIGVILLIIFSIYLIISNIRFNNK